VADEFTVSRTAVGAACAIFDDRGHVLLVHHTYGHLNWELPGGLGEEGEAPDETALRELREETGLRAELERLTGVYLEANHDFGPMLHFVFRSRWHDRLDPVVSSPEISELRYWPLDDLPRPISDFTERRIRDALVEQPVQVGRVDSRRWRE
jgi:8-oxo-dGTP pyrophosphatase MutT (NUDIX family)